MKKNLLLGLTGSIAAYKGADIINRLKDEYNITVVMTKSATKFITPLTMKVLSGNEVYIDSFEDETTEITHIDLVEKNEKILIAPATANIISKMANGICDDLLSTLLVVAKPENVIIAPAMNTNMYQNKVIEQNIKKLQDLGVNFIEPKEGLLACKDYGKGALANVEDIVNVIKEG